MKSDLEKNFLQHTKDPLRFNRDFGANPYKLEGVSLTKNSLLELNFNRWTFNSVTFEETNIQKCIFTETVFENCIFEFVEAKKNQFINCKFHKCKFRASKIDSSTFTGGEFSGNESESKMGFKPQFNTNVFTRFKFESNEFEELSFQFSKFGNSILSKNNLVGAGFLDCEFSNTNFSENQLMNTYFYSASFKNSDFLLNIRIGSFLATKFENSRFLLRSFSPDASESFGGAVLLKCLIELKEFKGTFDAGEGSENIYQNGSDKKENFGAGGADTPLINTTFKNIKCKYFGLSFGKFENCLFENIDADVFDGESMHLKNCSFRNIHIREIVNFKESKFENVKWENITVDPKCEFWLDNSTYKNKRPF